MAPSTTADREARLLPRRRAGAGPKLSVVLRPAPGSLVTTQVHEVSPRGLLVDDIDLPIGTRCRLELHSTDLRLSGRCLVANRVGGFTGLAVVAWDGPTASRAVDRLADEALD